MKKKLILKLIETNNTPKIGDLTQTPTNTYHLLTSDEMVDITKALGNKVVKPYGISDEEIKEGDTLYSENGSFRGIFHKIDARQPKAMILKKVEILPEQFNYQDIVDLGLKDGDEFELEGFEYVEDSTKEYDSGQPANKIAHILTRDLADLGVFEPTRMNIDIPDISKPSQVLYTEEEVLKLLIKHRVEVFSGIDTSNSVKDWFNQNRKK